MEIFYRINKKYWNQDPLEGGHPVPMRHQSAPPPQARPGTLWSPWPTSGHHFLVYKCICPKKIIEKTFGTVRRRLEAELGQEHFCSPAERFCRGYFPSGGGNHRHRHHQRSSHRGRTNLHQHLHQHHLISNPSSSLVSNLCLKTSDWYLWVTSSVDYFS